MPGAEEEPLDHHVQLTHEMADSQTQKDAPPKRRERRFLVAQAPHRAKPEPAGATGSLRAGDRSRVVPSLVGVLPWTADRPWLTILVRTTFRFDPADKRPTLPLVATDPEPFHVGSPSAERQRPDDFVPMKGALDLLLTGHVELLRSSSGDPRRRRAAVGLGDRLVRFVVDAEEAGKVPLRPPYTRGFGGHEVEVGPQPCHDGAAEDFRHDADFDPGLYQSAPAPQRYDMEGAESPGPLLVRVSGLFDAREEIALPLPPIAPRAIVDYTEAGSSPVDVELRLDTLCVDLDDRTVSATYRGHAETSPTPRTDVDRILLGWAAPGDWAESPGEAWRAALRELPRGTFGWAWERDDALAGRAPPSLDEDQLAMARYETWDFLEAAEPQLPPEDAATIAATLLEAGAPRRETLARHDLDEYTWSIEERAWAEHLSQKSRDEDDTTAARYAAAFASAQQSLETPREREISLAEYAALSVRAFRGDPMKALAEVGLGLGAWMRIERRFQAQAGADPAIEAEIARLRDEEEARLDAEEEAREAAERAARAESRSAARGRRKAT